MARPLGAGAPDREADDRDHLPCPHRKAVSRRGDDQLPQLSRTGVSLRVRTGHHGTERGRGRHHRHHRPPREPAREPSRGNSVRGRSPTGGAREPDPLSDAGHTRSTARSHGSRFTDPAGAVETPVPRARELRGPGGRAPQGPRPGARRRAHPRGRPGIRPGLHSHRQPELSRSPVAIPRRHRKKAGGGRDPHRQVRGGKGEQREEQLPRDDEPRASHSA